MPTNWQDYPNLSTAITAARLNNIEAGVVAAYVQGTGTLVNADIAAGAGIAYSKLGLANSIVNADVSASAAIAISKIADPGAGKVIGSLGAGAVAVTPTFSMILDVVVGRGQTGDPAAPAATIDSNTILGGNIPQTFKHLKLLLTGRGDGASLGQSVLFKVNNDATTANYYDEAVSNISATSVGASETNGTNAGLLLAAIACANASAGEVGSATVDIFDYASTTFFKTFISAAMFSTGTGSGSRTIYGRTGVYRQTGALTRIALFLASGNFIAGTRVTLYGLN